MVIENLISQIADSMISLLKCPDALFKVWRQSRPHVQVRNVDLNCSAPEL